MADEKDVATETAETQESGDKTYTAAELEAEADRRASKAAETARKNAAAEAERKIELERKKAEEARLKEQGEYKTLAEKSQAELEALKAELAERERRESIAGGLREAGLSDFEKVLLADRSDVDSFIDAAKSIKELFEKRVADEVERRLDTGKKAGAPASGKGQPTSGFIYPSMQQPA